MYQYILTINGGHRFLRRLDVATNTPITCGRPDLALRLDSLAALRMQKDLRLRGYMVGMRDAESRA